MSDWSAMDNFKTCNVNPISIKFWSRLQYIPINGGGQIYRGLTAISPNPTLHLARFKASSFSKPTLLLSFSTCVFHIFFGCFHFLLPFTSNSNTFFKTCSSSLLNTCPYHLTLFALRDLHSCASNKEGTLPSGFQQC